MRLRRTGELIDQAGINRTNLVVVGSIGIALLIAAYALLGRYYGTLVAVFLLYEAYTLIDAHPNDTLSESIWRLATRPLVPMLFGIAAGWGLGAGIGIHPGTWFAVGVLYGHFFFQREISNEEAVVTAKAAVEMAVRTGVRTAAMKEDKP